GGRAWGDVVGQRFAVTVRPPVAVDAGLTVEPRPGHVEDRNTGQRRRLLHGERVNRRHTVREVRGDSCALSPVEVSSGQILTRHPAWGSCRTCRLRPAVAI